ncbi:MAG: response regulator transcription factor [Flavobacteriaceae bacterium]|nr:response regulator transcription factor [Flavobacteriaceae bacterium]
MIKIIIAEDHQALIDGVSLLMKMTDDIQVLATATDGEMLIDRVRLYNPDVVLTDIRMPKIDGVAATKILIKEFPKLKVIAFSMFDQSEVIRDMLDAGAVGYLLKNSGLVEVQNAIRAVMQGNTYFDKNIDTSFLEVKKTRGNTDHLSDREIEILKCIARGKTNSEIADELCIGRSTVETHRKNMLRKLGLSGFNELVRYAIERKYDM